MNDLTFKNSFKKASIRFIWKYNEIEEYIPVINIAIHETYDRLNLIKYDTEEGDIDSVIITDSNYNKIAFAMYINNKKFKDNYSIYSIFREEFKTIAQGYIDCLGIGFFASLENCIRFYKDTQPDVAESDVIESWKLRQSLKRRIKNFKTLANKSVNRSRKVPPKMRFEVLKRDNYRCILCGITSGDTQLHLDHITPVVKGGLNTKDYLVTLCIDCNLGKGKSDFIK